MQPMPPKLSSTATADAIPTADKQDQNLNVAGDDQHQGDPNISPDESVPCRRKRRITDDDDEPIQTVPVKPAPEERILVTDTADESDANFAVILLPTSRQAPAASRATQPLDHTNTTPRRSERVSTKSQEEVRSKKLYLYIYAVLFHYKFFLHRTQTVTSTRRMSMKARRRNLTWTIALLTMEILMNQTKMPEK
jgi:hypothetical protein